MGFNNKVGEAIYKYEAEGEIKEKVVSLYNGNAYLIFVNEWKVEDGKYYSLDSFFCDKVHMKKCLGLEKGYGNIYVNKFMRLKTLRLSKKCRYLKDIVAAFVQAFDNINIEVYTEKKEG